MINARSRHHSSSPAAALVRLAAFLVTATSVVLIPFELGSAAYGRLSISSAFEWTVVAVGLTLVTMLAARSLDPMRR